MSRDQQNMADQKAVKTRLQWYEPVRVKSPKVDLKNILGQNHVFIIGV